MKKLLGIVFIIYFVGIASFTVTGLVIHDKLQVDEFTAEPLPDFRAYANVKAKKRAFFEYLSPIVDHNNAKLVKQRARLQAFVASLPTDSALKPRQQKKLQALALSWDIDPDLPQDQIIELLLRRVDVLPKAMVLAQAAKESGWGTSRFARKGNNLFGEWCYKKGCGVVPSKRSKGNRHEVRKFDSIPASVASYFNNINTHRAYTNARITRKKLRDNAKPVTALALIDELGSYSERGNDYIRELKKLVIRNKLEAEPPTDANQQAK